MESDDSVSNLSITPGGSRYYLPKCPDNSCKPFVDQLFDSLVAGLSFYKEYGRVCGFDTRKSAEKKHDDGTTISKYVVCSKAGFNEKKEVISNGIRNEVVRRRTVSGRCGCNAKVVLVYVDGGSYQVSKFVEAHNHDLASEIGRQFLKVNREMSCISRNFVFNASKVNIGPSKAYTLMKEMVGGYSNVGATVRDYRNFSRDLKEYVGERDAQMIIDKFKVKKDSCETFYYAYDLDGEGRLTKLFWADSVARRNYEIYGDAVSFDATFDTNKYAFLIINLVLCIIFIGALHSVYICSVCYLLVFPVLY